MIGAFQNVIRRTDSAIARIYLSLFTERNALIPFLFHSLFRDESEIALNLVDPLQRTTTSKFRQFIQYYLEHGYRFISPSDLLAGLGPDGKYAMITFDDGYYNNSLALPILKEFNVPATFFISTNHVLQNKGYWWDVYYRERTARGATDRQMRAGRAALKSLRTDQVEEKLVADFGAGALTPRGDIDRPFSPAELKEFASHAQVHLGNHTADHAILTNYTEGQMHEQLQSGQDALQSISGKIPTAIAYPNGDLTDRIVEICRERGFKFGFTVRQEKRRLPINGESPGLMRIGRFAPHGNASIESQCRTYRSDLSFYAAIRGGYVRLRRWQVA